MTYSGDGGNDLQGSQRPPDDTEIEFSPQSGGGGVSRQEDQWILKKKEEIGIPIKWQQCIIQVNFFKFTQRVS